MKFIHKLLLGFLGVLLLGTINPIFSQEYRMTASTVEIYDWDPVNEEWDYRKTLEEPSMFKVTPTVIKLTTENGEDTFFLGEEEQLDELYFQIPAVSSDGANYVIWLNLEKDNIFLSLYNKDAGDAYLKFTIVRLWED